MIKLFVDFCPPLKEIEFVVISEKKWLRIYLNNSFSDVARKRGVIDDIL